MRVLSSEDARLIDRHTMTKMGVSGETLMGQAGEALAKRIEQVVSTAGGKQVAIICGKGNNGGDGYAAAFHLSGADVEITLFSSVPEEKIDGDAKVFYDKCIADGMEVTFPGNMRDVDLSNFDLIVDGLLGTGIEGKVREEAVEWINHINASGLPVLSIDIPSGVSSDSGQVLGVSVEAGATVTMGFLKQGLVVEPGASLSGDLEIAELAYPEEAFQMLKIDKRIVEDSFAQQFLSKPAADTYKHRQGKVLVVGGCKGYTGAVCMASEAALRSGAGLVIAGIPESLNIIYESKLTEVITAPVIDDGKGYFTEKSVDHLKDQIEWCDVSAVGPGLGTSGESVEFAKRLLSAIDKPVVIDADGLRVLHGNPGFVKSMSNEFILTPHAGEAAAIFGIEKQTIIDDPFQFTLESAREVGGVFVLKGAPTLISDGASVVANTSGHQGLATGGTGDVLTGLIAGFLAQGVPLFDAAQLGVYIHGKAADALLASHGYRGLIAGDLLKSVPSVIAGYECD
ncbi:MAG: NAD(P)H-hydrate dehydratase [Candidatus Marinimicrobia bacterium]|jgi:NAD(P)H-hydrate epimerase|nr:NAD(P)H-hydrate dehydratase [Candidatus Neomarinimicrobiota bacterium]MDP6592767.1 NAD(P)H-hydrate dehydratase [Candidatus Neomarinimicrobiota bacterium]MDP6836288.1 NAD(P)H-hydrate dehydratase [Candidatus Neomarinimicrobiota bacterium]